MKTFLLKFGHRFLIVVCNILAVVVIVIPLFAVMSLYYFFKWLWDFVRKNDYRCRMLLRQADFPALQKYAELRTQYDYYDDVYGIDVLVADECKITEDVKLLPGDARAKISSLLREKKHVSFCNSLEVLEKAVAC